MFLRTAFIIVNMFKFFRYFRVQLIFACSFSLIALQGTLEGAYLHVLLVGDTSVFGLGPSLKTDLEKMKGEVKKIAKASELKLKLFQLKGSDVLPYKVYNYIDQLAFKKDDVIILYFTMHGFRTPARESKWPNLFFHLVNQGIDFEQIIHRVQAKKPKLLLAIADSCNSIIADGLVPMASKKVKPLIRGNDKKIKAAYHKLFQRTKGVVIVSSSLPGQASWAYQYGSVFTHNFINELESLAKSGNSLSWDLFLRKVSDRVINFTSTVNSFERQDPQYELLIN